MNKKLYVGNLSYDVTEGELQTHFAKVGPVASASLITDRNTGRSKGFGFVEMETEEAASAAIEQLNNQEWAGRTISVSEARPQRERSFGGGGGGFGGGNRGGGGDRRGGGGGYGGGGDRRGGGGGDRRGGGGDRRGGGGGDRRGGGGDRRGGGGGGYDRGGRDRY